MVRATLFLNNRSQAVRLPKEVAFPPGIRDVVLVRQGQGVVILPADRRWDDFFDAQGADLGPREQPAAEVRDALS